MAFTSATTVIVRGKYLDATGAPMKGRVVFTPQVTRVRNEDDNEIVVGNLTPVVGQLDNTGSFSVTLLANDDAGLDPTGWTYRVTEQLKSAVAVGGFSNTATASYGIAITSSMAPGPVWIADIDPTTPVVLDGSGGYVRSINGEQDIVVITLTDLGAGNSATRNVGTTNGTVAAGDDSRIVNAVPNTGGSLTGALNTTRTSDASSFTATNSNSGGNTANASYLATSADGVGLAFAARVTGDTNRRVQVTAGGVVQFGSGSVTPDTNLYRSAADTLKTDDTFHVGGDSILLGSAGDVNLYRVDANTLGTDDGVLIGQALRHAGTTAGFYGASATAQPEVTGSRGGNAALASLLTALDTLGLITDSTTA